MSDTLIQLKHRDAFCLVCYARPDNTNGEILWNSRDGFTPASIKSLEDGDVLHRTATSFKPEHRPVIGERIIVDMTPQRAVVLAAECLEELERRDRAGLEKAFESRTAALAHYESRFKIPNAPDVLVVTAGYLETHKEWLPTGPSKLKQGEPQFESRLAHYDRKGRLIDMWEWMYLFEDKSYQQLVHTDIDPNTWVSTIWLGSDHGFSLDPNAKPVIFETMCFKRLPEPKKSVIGDREHEFDEDGQWRWCTEAEALAGHETICAEVRRRRALARKGVS